MTQLLVGLALLVGAAVCARISFVKIDRAYASALADAPVWEQARHGDASFLFGCVSVILFTGSWFFFMPLIVIHLSNIIPLS